MASPASNLNFGARSDAALSVSLLGVLFLLLVPLPSALLDMLLVLNLGTAILLLLVTLSAKKPLELSVFPSLLLLLTLYRMSLNVATTRLILLNGDAGKVVSTFGGFVVGGNLVVGLVIFIILIVIQFIVITKGATRISEVNARFVLDAMPGKQMAIDAELNTGTIDEDEARERRETLTNEAEFYGAMDGAGKFVRGDAIAGLIITAVNLVGGVVLGVSNGLTVMEAIRRYSILTIGDGLVSQIPALIIATTAGILVTKNTSESSLGGEIGSQLSTSRAPLLSGAIVLTVISFAPGLPKLPFWLMSVALVVAFRMSGQEPEPVEEPEQEPEETDPEDEHLQAFAANDRVCIEVGARLIPAAMSKGDDGLSARIATLRKDLTNKSGIWVPSIRIRDEIGMEPSTYRILINGRETARAKLDMDRLLAINPGSTTLTMNGVQTIDPAFGLDAVWIEQTDRPRAELGGYTVVEPVSVLIAHLGEELRKSASDLLSRDDLKKMLEQLKKTAPAVVDEMNAESIRVAMLHQVVVRLLEERIPVTNLLRILESVLNHTDQTQEPTALTELVREDLARDICDRFRNDEAGMRVIVLEPRLESFFREKLMNGRLVLAPHELEIVIGDLSESWRKHSLQSEIALLTDRPIRRPLREAIQRAIPDLDVLAYTEIPKEIRIEPADIIRARDELLMGTDATGIPQRTAA